MERERIEEIVSRHRHEKAALLAILHEVQEEDKELSMESLRYISELMDVSYAHIYGLATFYSAFSTARKGDIQVRVCDGIACHLNGANEVIEALKSRLNVEVEGTTWDETYSLDKVQCLGLCSIGPNMVLDGKTYSRLKKEKIIEILLGKKGTGNESTKHLGSE